MWCCWNTNPIRSRRKRVAPRGVERGEVHVADDGSAPALGAVHAAEQVEEGGLPGAGRARRALTQLPGCDLAIEGAERLGVAVPARDLLDADPVAGHAVLRARAGYRRGDAASARATGQSAAPSASERAVAERERRRGPAEGHERAEDARAR